MTSCFTVHSSLSSICRYNHRIQVLDPQGRFLRAFGSQGTADGKFNYPWGVTTDALGFIYVCDKENHRVQVSGCRQVLPVHWQPFLQLSPPSSISICMQIFIYTLSVAGPCPICHTRAAAQQFSWA